MRAVTILPFRHFLRCPGARVGVVRWSSNRMLVEDLERSGNGFAGRRCQPLRGASVGRPGPPWPGQWRRPSCRCRASQSTTRLGGIAGAGSVCPSRPMRARGRLRCRGVRTVSLSHPVAREGGCVVRPHTTPPTPRPPSPAIKSQTPPCSPLLRKALLSSYIQIKSKTSACGRGTSVLPAPCLRPGAAAFIAPVFAISRANRG